MAKPFSWIDSNEGLSKVCSVLEEESVIALDTECVREKTYYPIVALAQIASSKGVFLIDLTIPNDYSPLCAVLSNPRIVKVIHAARQDCQVFNQIGCTIKMPVFDTQLAAAFLGMAPQIGYKELVKQYLSVELSKECTRSDWLQRPLSSKQENYAIEDVIHLLQIYEALNRELVDKNKYPWFADESECTLEALHNAINLAPEKMSIRVAGQNGIVYRSQREKLHRLTNWREYKAQLTNIPRRWLLSDKNLVQLACLENPSAKQVSQLIVRCPKQYRTQWQTEIQNILLSVSDDKQPIEISAPDRKEQKQINRLSAAIKEIAIENNIDSTLIATRKDITRLIMDNDQRIHKLFTTGWRKTLFQDVLPSVGTASDDG